jgi:hypothetical protein
MSTKGRGKKFCNKGRKRNSVPFSDGSSTNSAVGKLEPPVNLDRKPYLISVHSALIGSQNEHVPMRSALEIRLRKYQDSSHYRKNDLGLLFAIHCAYVRLITKKTQIGPDEFRIGLHLTNSVPVLINLPPKKSATDNGCSVRCFLFLVMLFLVIDATTYIGYHRCQARVFGLPRESGGVFLEPFLSRLRWALARS